MRASFWWHRVWWGMPKITLSFVDSSGGLIGLSSVQFSHSVVSDSLRPQESQQDSAKSCVHGCDLHAWVLSRFSLVWLFVTLWIIAHQAPLSMLLSGQESWNGLPCPPPGDLDPTGQTWISYVSCIDRQVLYTRATWEAPVITMKGHKAKSAKDKAHGTTSGGKQM